MSFAKITEFDSIPENILRLTVTVRFQIKNQYFKNVNFLSFFQSISYNNVVVTKVIYFSSAFLKSWVDIFDNIAGVAADPECY